VREQGRIHADRRIDLPAAPAEALDQEYVVLIRMGADTALIGGIGDHDVVQAPVGVTSD